MIVLVWYCLIIVWWSTTRFQSHSNQNFCLANPKLPGLLATAGHWYSQCVACMSPSCMNMAGPATCGCQGVAQPDCWGPRRNSAKLSCLPCIWTNFWRPQCLPYRAYLARIPRNVHPEISKTRPMAAAFIPATEVPTTRHRWASVMLIVAVWRKFCDSNATDGPIYGPRFCDYWLDYHEAWQEWSRGVNFEV